MGTRLKFRPVCAAIGIAFFSISSVANATVHRVYPGGSIQAAIDKAAPGDTILVEPGTYRFLPPAPVSGQYYYGLRIKTDNLRLIGKVVPGKGDAGKVRLVYDAAVDPENNPRAADVGAGVYAAPDVSLPGDPTKRSCDPDVSDNSALGQLCKANSLKGFYIRGFTVEGFPVNGIQTRWVDGFEFVQNESVNNLNNGIYPTLSANGLVQNNVSYGSLDTAMWVAGSENVRVIGNDLSKSTIGFEITVSNNVWVTQNKMYNNTLGIGLFHPNAAGNPPNVVPAMANWVIEQNDVRDNNLTNPAVPGTFQSELPSGIGILLLGVSDHVIAKNTVAGNKFVGIGVLGWCTANAANPERCDPSVLLGLPTADNNLISQNKVSGNGGNPNPKFPLPSVDILYVQTKPFEPGIGNCFEKNKPAGFTFYSSEPDGQLPTDGCEKP